MAASVDALIRLALSEGLINEAESRKLTAFVQQRQGDARLAATILVKHHGVTPDQAERLLADAAAPASSARGRETAPGSRPPAPSGGPRTMRMAPPAARPPRERLGDCDLGELLGKGAMGAVFRGYHAGFDREFAVKLLPRERTKNKKFVDGFLREARTLLKIQDRHVVGVQNVGDEDGQYFIVMELVDGSDLGKHIERAGQLDETEAARVIRDAARGLHAAHEAGLVHRDVKPDNIMITNDGVVKVADFGLAIEAEPDTGDELKKRPVCGTPYYMPPEQADGSPADHRADIYALGCTLYHALTGRVPFKGKTLMDILCQHVTKPAPDPRECNDKVSETMAKIVGRMMEKEREDRFADMTAVAEVLDALISGEAPTAKLEAPTEGAAARPRALADRPLPKLPEPLPVRGFAVSSSLVSVGLVVAFGLLNLPVVRALSSDGAAPPPARQVFLQQLEKDLRDAKDSPKLFQQRHEVFVAAHPDWREAAEAIRERVSGRERLTAEELQARWSALEEQVKGELGAGKLRLARARLEAWPPADAEGAKPALSSDLTKARRSLIAAVDARLLDDAGLVPVPGDGESAPLFIARCEVSCADYAAFLAAEPTARKPEGWTARTCPEGAAARPVTGVSFAEAEAYAAWKGLRLPTDREWTRAATGGEARDYPWGKASAAVYARMQCRGTEPAGLAKVTAFSEGELVGTAPCGALNMAGNAAEWVRPDQDSAAPENATGPGTRPVRGGSFKARPEACRTTVRVLMTADTRAADIGFRCAADWPTPEPPPAGPSEPESDD